MFYTCMGEDLRQWRRKECRKNKERKQEYKSRKRKSKEKKEKRVNFKFDVFLQKYGFLSEER